MGLFSRLCCYYLKESACNVCVNELQPGDKVKDINPECKEKNAKGIVKSVKKVKDGNKIAGNLIEFEVENKGQHYKPGQKLKKTEIQLKKLKESFKMFISEATLSRSNFNMNLPRIETLIRKLENKEPFALAGSIVPTLTIEPQAEWLQDLKGTKQVKTSYIPTESGENIMFSSLQKTAEFGSTGQRGGEFEDRFYKTIKDLLQEGPFKLKIKDKTYEVTGIEEPAKQKNILADIVIDTEDGEIFLSLKENTFFTYGGISFRGREYQKEVSTQSVVKKYVKDFRKYLISIGNCQQDGDKILCDPKGKRYYLAPNYDQKFMDFVLFGEEKYKDARDYADFVVIEGSDRGQIFEQDGEVYVLNSSYKIKERGDKLDAQDEPVFLSRFRKAVKNDMYGFIKTRTLIARRKSVGNAINLKELI